MTYFMICALLDLGPVRRVRIGGLEIDARDADVTKGFQADALLADHPSANTMGRTIPRNRPSLRWVGMRYQGVSPERGAPDQERACPPGGGRALRGPAGQAVGQCPPRLRVVGTPRRVDPTAQQHRVPAVHHRAAQLLLQYLP